MSEGKSARVVQVIRSNLTMRGEGVPPHDPIRQVVQFWSVEGRLLAEVDPVHQGWLRGYDAAQSVLNASADSTDDKPWAAIMAAYSWARTHLFGHDKVGQKRHISGDFLLGLRAMQHLISGTAPPEVLARFKNPEIGDPPEDPRSHPDHDAGQVPGE